MTVRDMKGLGHGNNPFRHTMAGADDQIIAPKIEVFDGRGKEAEVIAIIFCHSGEVLEEGSLDPHPLDDSRESIFDMDECIEIGLRVKPAKNLKDPLSSPHPREPVMDDGDLHTFPPSIRKLPSAKSIGHSMKSRNIFTVRDSP